MVFVLSAQLTLFIALIIIIMIIIIIVEEKRTYGYELRVTIHHCNMILYILYYTVYSIMLQ